MQYFKIPNQNFLLMSEAEQKDLTQKYKRVFHCLPQDTSLTVIVQNGDVYFCTEALPETVLYIKELFRSFSKWVTEASEEEVERITKPDGISATAICTEWSGSVDPKFMWYAQSVYNSDTAIRITVTPVTASEASNAYKVALELTVFGDGAESKLRSFAELVKEQGVYLYTPDEKSLTRAVRRTLSGLSEICSEDVCGNLIPFTVQECNDEKGFNYGVNKISKNPLCYDRKRSKLSNGMIVGQSGSGRNNAMWHEVREVLSKTKDDVIVIDPTDYSEERARNSSEVVELFGEQSRYHINPLDIVLTHADAFADGGEAVCNICDVAVAVLEGIIDRELNEKERNAVRQSCTDIFTPFVKRLLEEEKTQDTEHNPTLFDVVRNIKGGSEKCKVFAERIREFVSEEGRSLQEDKECAPFFEKLNEVLDSVSDPFPNVLFKADNMEIIKRLSHTTDMPHGRAVTLVLHRSVSHSSRLAYAGISVMIRYAETRIYKNYHEVCGTKNYGKNLWVYFEDINQYILKRDSCIDLLLTLFKRSRVHGGIVTACATDYRGVFGSVAQALISNSGFFLFLAQSQSSCDIIRKVHGFNEGETELMRRGIGTGLLYNNQFAIPLECRWDENGKERSMC